MHLKELKKIFCGLLMLVMAFGCVGSKQAFCITEDEKKVEELIGYVTKGETERVDTWLAQPDADRLLKCKVDRWLNKDMPSSYCTRSRVYRRYDEDMPRWRYEWLMRSLSDESIFDFREVSLNVIEVVADEVVEKYRKEGDREHTDYLDAKSHIDRDKVKYCIKAILDHIANSKEWGAEKFKVTSPPAGKVEEYGFLGACTSEEWKIWDVWLRKEFKEKYADKYPDRFEIIETRRAWKYDAER